MISRLVSFILNPNALLTLATILSVMAVIAFVN